MILTDERQAAIIESFHDSEYPDLNSFTLIYINVELCEQISLRCILGAALRHSSDYRYNPRPPPQLILGALNLVHDNNRAPISVQQPPMRYSDFDVYTMQRHWPDIFSFLSWKREAQRTTLSRQLNVGDLFDIDVDALSKREQLLRFTLPLEKPPMETLDLLMKHPRSRSSEVDGMLALARICGTLRLRITEVVKSKDNAYSRVFFGSLEWTLSTPDTPVQCQTQVCLKLFDESLFPVPNEEECAMHWDAEPQGRFVGMSSAVDMMQQELAVYERLQYLQGTLLPYTYGFHEVSLLVLYRCICTHLSRVYPH